MKQCIYCDKICEGESWNIGECCIAGNFFACSRKCAEDWCKQEKIDFYIDKCDESWELH